MNGRAAGSALPAFFHARRSRGYLSLATVTALLGFAAVVNLPKQPVIGLVLVAVTACMAALTLCFPLMRYVVSDSVLSAEYGPVLRWRIPLAEVSNVSRVRLAPSFFVALVMPGIALYGMRSAGHGRVRMCATKTITGVYLVETRNGTRYGFTPADEQAFEAALRRRGIRVTGR
ncbi:PH domain-containing protein [Nonomuraea sp. NPDC059007]|uniref:PH domain-containing protein n=1 Tax=Nonomuraea sp. NPDC059007 TaxID=3346692 RepID=UPI0036B7E4A7